MCCCSLLRCLCFLDSCWEYCWVVCVAGARVDYHCRYAHFIRYALSLLCRPGHHWRPADAAGPAGQPPPLAALAGGRGGGHLRAEQPASAGAAACKGMWAARQGQEVKRTNACAAGGCGHCQAPRWMPCRCPCRCCSCCSSCLWLAWAHLLPLHCCGRGQPSARRPPAWLPARPSACAENLHGWRHHAAPAAVAA